MNSEHDKKAKKAMDRRAFLNSLNRGTLATSALVGSFTKAWAAKDEGASAPATVDTTAGKIRGAQQGKVYPLKGVPYGAPTGGKMRFLPAGKPEPWTGVKDALEYGHRCPAAARAFSAGVGRDEHRRAAGRRLPGSQYLEHGSQGRAQAAGDGLPAWRRIRERSRQFHLL